jgi:hypothetical protein
MDCGIAIGTSLCKAAAAQTPLIETGQEPTFVKSRKTLLLVATVLATSVALAAWLMMPVPGSALAQDQCSASCRAVYGSCYKRSQNREQCQLQWQRCLEQCRHAKR